MISDYLSADIYLPDFLIVGAAKCGTTSLASNLNTIDNIYIPEVKECRFLSGLPSNYKGPGDHLVNEMVITDIGEYSKLFKNPHESQKISCDASVDYFYFYKETIEKINELYPSNKKPKIIIMLRNPLERALSMYSHLKMRGREQETFSDALKLCEERIKNEWEWVWDYIGAGLYFKGVKAFIENFGKANVKIIFFNEFKNNTEEVIKETLLFLDKNFDEKLDVKTKVYNKSGVPKNKKMHDILMSLNNSRSMYFIRKIIPKKLINWYWSKMIDGKYKMEEKEQLLNLYKNDIEHLEEYLEVDLSNWKKGV
jgi:hypothetical protein